MTCPLCGGIVHLHTDGRVGVPYARPLAIRGERLRIEMKPLPFLSCSACEYCVRVNPKDRTARIT